MDGKVHKNNGYEHLFDIEHYIVPVISGLFFGIFGISYGIRSIKRKEAEKALAEREETFRLFYEKSPLGYQSLDSNGKLLAVNQSWLKEFDYHNKNEVIGKSFESFIHKSQKHLFKNRFANFKKNGSVKGVEWKMITNKGHIKYIEFDGEASYIDGKFVKSYCVLRNITEQKEAAKALIESEKKFRSYFESCPIGVFIVNENGYYIDTNSAAEKLLDYGKEELFARRISDIMAPEFMEKGLAGFDKLRKIGQSSNETSLMKKDGTGIPVLINAVKLSNSEFIGFVTDLSRIKNAEASLRESESMFRLIAEHPDLSISIFQDGKFVFRNMASDELFGYSNEEVREMGPSFLKKTTHPDYLDFVKDQTKKSADGRPSIYDYKIICKNSEVKWIRNHSIAVEYKGKIAELIFCNNITAQKETEKRLLETKESINRIERMDTVFRMGNTLAHDLNNLLTILAGNVSLTKYSLEELLKSISIMLEKPNNSITDLREIVELLKEKQISLTEILDYQIESQIAINRGAKQTNRLLKATKKPDLNVNVYEIQTLKELVDEAISFGLKTNSKIQIKKVYKNDLPNSEFDIDIVAHILLNIVINAMHALEEKELDEENGTISLTIENYHQPIENKEYIRLIIEDNGIGIPKENQENIFKPFFTTKIKGYGIGLSSSFDQIIEMGGLMDFSSEPGVGSKFNVYLPISNKSVMIKTDPESDIKSYSGTILVIDDEEQIRTVMKQNLESKGFDVIVAENGKMGLKTLNKFDKQITGVLSDILMPIMNGTEFYEEAIKSHPDLKYVFMTGYFDEINISLNNKVPIFKKPLIDKDFINICQNLSV